MDSWIAQLLRGHLHLVICSLLAPSIEGGDFALDRARWGGLDVAL
jgi:hypothetical protein